MSTRWSLLRWARRGAAASVLAVLSGATLADTVRISGVGLSAPLMQRLADVYRTKEPADTVQVIVPPLGSDGSVRALAAGELDLAVTGRPLKADETAAVGRAVELGRTPFGFATSDGVRAAGVSAGDVADIYAGRLMRWDDDKPIRLILRAERETDTKLVRAISEATNVAMDAAFNRKGLVVADNDLDTARLLESVPGSFGPMTTGLARLQNSRVRFLPFNGVLPSVKTLADGKYPLAKPLFIVEPKLPGKAASRFVAFLKSPQAAEVMAAAEFLPTK
jgi:phosphate transport system substrate-binding protein